MLVLIFSQNFLLFTLCHQHSWMNPVRCQWLVRIWLIKTFLNLILFHQAFLISDFPTGTWDWWTQVLPMKMGMKKARSNSAYFKAFATKSCSYSSFSCCWTCRYNCMFSLYQLRDRLGVIIKVTEKIRTCGSKNSSWGSQSTLLFLWIKSYFNVYSEWGKKCHKQEVF